MCPSPDPHPAHGLITRARAEFFERLRAGGVLTVSAIGVPSNADKDSPTSVAIAKGVETRIGQSIKAERLSGQKAGADFEEACRAFLADTFLLLPHLRPGKWRIEKASRRGIAELQQYAHLSALANAAAKDKELAAALGRDYIIKPDVLIIRDLESDEEINTPNHVVDSDTASLASIRAVSGGAPLLHASVSCKWTLRSDRAQNARTEALNLVRNRKGRLPHIVVITGDPLPSRLASLALGTGDVDCVYHFALPELVAAVAALGQSEPADLLEIMIEGKRLKDISDLPLDLAV